ncbi:MAG: DivIVA domain-containing protein, partial [Actinomycetota bacterium]
MPFEPEEIENKEFLSTLRGYDRDEVRAFLQDVADDYRGVLQLLNQRQKPVATVKDPFDVLGVELGQILKVARESGGQLRKKAEAEASTLMEKVDQEARTIRESADKQARRQREEADRYARDVRSRTDRDAAEKTRRAAETVEQLRRAEAKLRERFASMEGILEALKRELGPEGAAALGPREKAAGAGAGRTGSTP